MRLTFKQSPVWYFVATNCQIHAYWLPVFNVFMVLSKSDKNNHSRCVRAWWCEIGNVWWIDFLGEGGGNKYLWSGRCLLVFISIIDMYFVGLFYASFILIVVYKEARRPDSLISKNVNVMSWLWWLSQLRC